MALMTSSCFSFAAVVVVVVEWRLGVRFLLVLTDTKWPPTWHWVTSYHVTNTCPAETKSKQTLIKCKQILKIYVGGVN